MSERDNIRHQRILEQIKNAKTLKDLPNVTVATLTKYLSDKKYFDDKKISSKEFLPVVEARFSYGIFLDEHVQDAFIEVLEKNYPGKTQKEYMDKFDEVAIESKAEHIVFEIQKRNQKIYEIKKEEFTNKHKEVMHQIGAATEINELPKVSRAKVSSYILSLLDDEGLREITSEDIKKVVKLLIEYHQDLKSDDVQLEIYNICRAKYLFTLNQAYDKLCASLVNDYKLPMLVEEVISKEKRITQIHKQDHEYVMEQIRNANRISDLPKGLSLSTITSYLSGNTTIYPKAEQIPASEFVEIANMLLEGYLLQDIAIIEELKDIAFRYYPEKSKEAFRLLHSRFLKLPKVYYYAEEVKYIAARQQEFIARGGSCVFTYMVPNPNSPLDAGKFYNIYISRTRNLDLEEILPLDLDKIVPKNMDIDSIEYYVKKNYDSTFKLAGGIIINRDETIGDVKIFKPSDGMVGVTPEEKSKLDELKDLSKKLKSLIKTKKEEAEKFNKMQQEFLESQEQLNEEFNMLEEKIKKLGEYKDE